MTHRVDILSHDKRLDVPDGANLADAIQSAGIPLSTVCRKKGRCGKCLVEIISPRSSDLQSLGPLVQRPSVQQPSVVGPSVAGSPASGPATKGRWTSGLRPPVPSPSKATRRHKPRPTQFVKSCQILVHGDLSIRIPESSLVSRAASVQTALQIRRTVSPAVEKVLFLWNPPGISDPRDLRSILQKALPGRKLDIPLEILKTLPDLLGSDSGTFTLIIRNRDEVIGVNAGDTRNRLCGLAVDIGTTTVAAELIDLRSGKTLDSEWAMNGQIRYGSDVVTRITMAYMEPNGLLTLRQAVLDTVNNLCDVLLRRNAVDPADVCETVVAANTSMNHFFLGVSVRSLAVAPFQAVYQQSGFVSAGVVGINVRPGGEVFVVPNLHSFVGGDITAGLVASRLMSKQGTHLFMDLGTNGEIALKQGRHCVVASTAAGPAFEGASITHGMMAKEGAICGVERTDGKVKFRTVGDKKPIGICGSGLIDLIQNFLISGKINSRGKIQDPSGILPVSGTITLNQKDVREFQLAVSAVKAGIKVLLCTSGLALDDLDGVWIAGAFGNSMNIENAQAIGLVPPVPREKIVFLGNSSLAGAAILLVSSPEREKLLSWLPRVSHGSLATHPKFQDWFLDAFTFGDPDYFTSDPDTL